MLTIRVTRRALVLLLSGAVALGAILGAAGATIAQPQPAGAAAIAAAIQRVKDSTTENRLFTITRQLSTISQDAGDIDATLTTNQLPNQPTVPTAKGLLGQICRNTVPASSGSSLASLCGP
jgi:hypothetical protein